MLRDPLRRLEAVKGVCRGSIIVLDTVSPPLALLPARLARLNARRGALEWFVFNPRGLAQALRMAGFEIEAKTGVFRPRRTGGRPPAAADRPQPPRRNPRPLSGRPSGRRLSAPAHIRPKGVTDAYELLAYADLRGARSPRRGAGPGRLRGWEL